MSYTALYRKFRPSSFAEMVGQEHITKTLRNQIISNRVGHAYLLNGGRGTGKTSSAKILARAINCLNPDEGEPCNECEICKESLNGSLTDIVEMDAASNNSVEDIRGIREEVNFLPTKAKYRVYIIDEVHMLSTGAFNALLKTLEEPPSHVKFILATTEPQKLPATILSRCQRFDFKKISNDNIVKRLEIVCKESNINIDKTGLNIIASLSEGAMRDALSILERCIQDGDNNISDDKIKELVGLPKIEYIHNICEGIIEQNVDKVINSCDEILNEGKDITNTLWELIKYIKDILVYKTTNKVELYNETEVQNLKNVAENVTKEKLIDLIYSLSELENNVKWSTQKTVVFQAGIIKLCANTVQSTNTVGTQTDPALVTRIEKIENYLRNSSATRQRSMETMSQQPSVRISNAAPVENTRPNVENRNYSSEVSKAWPQILSDLKKTGKIVLYTNLTNTKAVEINDMTVGIEFQKNMTSFGKTILEKHENVKELSDMFSIACKKPMQIKYLVPEVLNSEISMENDLMNLANGSDIPFNIVE